LYNIEDVRITNRWKLTSGNITAGSKILFAKTGRRRSFKHTSDYPFDVKSLMETKFGKQLGGAVWLDPEKTKPHMIYQFLAKIKTIVTLLK